VVVEDHGDQANGEHDAGRNSPSQLKPHGEQGDFLADPLSLDISAKEIVGKNRQQRTEEKFKHGLAPGAFRSELR
jgi:hypothetical protein